MSKATHHANLDVLIKDTRESLRQMLDSAIASGAVTAEEIDETDFVLAKMIFTIWSDKRTYAPLDESNNRKMKNLAHFI